ncbi:S8/S53 family peptidase [Kutzneria buriramensis]|uniref:S8/S53 family peptidase n=1 Tax=Kutzneria buriramensis TaxID=1045776 RepID=UPI0014773FA8|nr:S8/S53 family peptidase [Kutzneria buriramensis]
MTLGIRRRAERRLPLVPGEVVVCWLQEPGTGAVSEALIRLLRTPLAGGARARGLRDVQEARGEERPGVAPRVFVLTCRPGRERDLVRLVLRAGRSILRRRRARWVPGTFRASRVPWLDLSTDIVLGHGFTPTRAFETALESVRVDLDQQPDCGQVKIGVLDAGVHEDALGHIADRMTVTHRRKDGYRTYDEPRSRTSHRHGTLITSIIATLAPQAVIDVIDVANDLPTPLRQQLAASWMHDAIERYKDFDLLNVSATLNGEGAILAPEFEMTVRTVIAARAENHPVVVVAACGNIHVPATGQHRTPLDAMGFPANDVHVVAVSSTDGRLVPVPERTGDKVGDLFWHMPGGTVDAPFAHDGGDGDRTAGHGSSLAAAVFTGVLARLLVGKGSAGFGTVGRERTLLVAEGNTRFWHLVNLHGRARPSSRGLLDANE